MIQQKGIICIGLVLEMLRRNSIYELKPDRKSDFRKFHTFANNFAAGAARGVIFGKYMPRYMS